MKITRQNDLVVVEDGAGARYGLGVLVPALLAGVLAVLIWPPAVGHHRFDLDVLAFAVVALALAVLNPPRTAEFDLRRREVRLKIGWPPLLGRRKTIAFERIREVKISQLIHLSDDIGSARPILLLQGGEKVYLSTYKRSPKRCREIIEQIGPLLATSRAST